MKIKYLINFLSIGSIFSGNFISESCSKLVNALPDSLKEKFSNPYILCTLGGFTLGSGLSYLLFKDSHSAMSDVEVDTQPLKTHQAGIQATAERQEIATQAVPEKKDIDIQVFFDMAPRALEILNAGLPVEENLITSLDSQREEIFTLMSRFDPNYERSYIEGLESNNKKIEEKTGYKIPLRSLYLFLGLSNEVAFNLPFWVLSKLIDEKVDYLISNGLEKEKASWLLRQLKWIIKNRASKESYDYFLQNKLEELIKNNEEELSQLSGRLEEIIELKNIEVAKLHQKESEIYGGIKADLKSFLKSDSKLVDTFKKAAREYQNFWSKDPKDAVISTLHGALFLHLMVNNDDISRSINSYFEKININAKDLARSFIIYLFVAALQKDQHFNEGSFIIYLDKISEIFKYLSKISHERVSSHLKGVSEQKNFGLDLENLPEDKTHVLFIEVVKNVMFVKPENYGLTGFSNILGHSWEFVKARYRKIAGTDEQPGYRKERIPKIILDKFKKLIKQSGLAYEEGEKIINERIAEANLLGIRSIHRTLKEFSKEAVFSDSEEFLDSINSLITEIEESYDHLNLRFGREVIFTDKDIFIFNHEQIRHLIDILNA